MVHAWHIFSGFPPGCSNFPLVTPVFPPITALISFSHLPANSVFVCVWCAKLTQSFSLAACQEWVENICQASSENKFFWRTTNLTPKINRINQVKRDVSAVGTAFPVQLSFLPKPRDSCSKVHKKADWKLQHSAAWQRCCNTSALKFGNSARKRHRTFITFHI